MLWQLRGRGRFSQPGMVGETVPPNLSLPALPGIPYLLPGGQITLTQFTGLLSASQSPQFPAASGRVTFRNLTIPDKPRPLLLLLESQAGTPFLKGCLVLHMVLAHLAGSLPDPGVRRPRHLTRITLRQSCWMGSYPTRTSFFDYIGSFKHCFLWSSLEP